MSADPPIPFFVESCSNITRVEDAGLQGHLTLLRRPAVIDASQFQAALAALGPDPDMDAALTAVLMSRIRFQGTDGMRGRVAADSDINCAEQFTVNNEITPAFVELSCMSFGQVLLDAQILNPGDWVLIGEDGRDLYGNDNLYRAACIGFGRAGLSIMSMGMCPTPELSFQMLNLAVRAGVMMTASHNPSDQNGLKFFVDGAKLLPEDGCGDYVLSAYIAALSSESSEDDDLELNIAEVSDEARAVFVESIIEQLPAMDGSDLFVVLDPANGAFSAVAPQVLDRLGVQFEVINGDPLGHNINQDGGVAELEGTDSFDGAVSDEVFNGYLPPVKRIFDEGRKREERVFGISLDGDGDRGYLLAYEKEHDRVNVLNGDICAFLIARLMKDVHDDRSVFYNTVESDLMTNYYAESELGLKTRIMCVGDKWISRSDDSAMLLGEGSGHVIIPTEVNRVRLRTGNGLLTGLYTLAAIIQLGLTDDEAAHPFPAGAACTWYTYFTDRARFARDSSVWKEDSRIIEEGLQACIDGGGLPPSSKFVLDLRMEDPGMLLYSVTDASDMPIASLFVRNSGAETKTAVYLRTSCELIDVLRPVAEQVTEHHRNTMKDESRPEFRIEQTVLETLQKGSASVADLMSRLDRETAPLLEAVIYCLRKEHRIIRSEDTVSLPSV